MKCCEEELAKKEKPAENKAEISPLRLVHGSSESQNDFNKSKVPSLSSCSLCVLVSVSSVWLWKIGIIKWLNFIFWPSSKLWWSCKCRPLMAPQNLYNLGAVIDGTCAHLTFLSLAQLSLAAGTNQTPVSNAARNFHPFFNGKIEFLGSRVHQKY